MSARATRWKCARCEVSVGRIDGESSRLPETWSCIDGVSYCLSCSRARAADAGSEAAPEDVSREDLVRLRRTALIAFEIARTPAAPDRVIAGACRTSPKAVAAVRGELPAGASAAAHPTHTAA